jgi:hypothetical protein
MEVSLRPVSVRDFVARDGLPDHPVEGSGLFSGAVSIRKNTETGAFLGRAFDERS